MIVSFDISSVLIWAGHKPKKCKDLFKLVDQSSFDIMWFNDMPHLCNPYIDMIRAAEGTRRIRLGLGCTNPYTRNPYITASAISRVNELSKGRLVLALGAGSRDILNSMNMDWEGLRTIEKIKETVKVCRIVPTGEPMKYSGDIYKIRNAKIHVEHPEWHKHIPIYIAGRRPHMLMMAGALADGFLFDDIPVEYVPYAINKIKEGAKAANRSLAGFRFADLIPFAFSEDRDKARELVKPSIVICFQTISKRELDLAKIDIEDWKLIMKTYPDLEKASKLVTDEMVDKFSVSGNLDECIKRLDAYVKAGINELYLGFPSDAPNVTKMIEILNEQVIPKFKKEKPSP